MHVGPQQANSWLEFRCSLNDVFWADPKTAAVNFWRGETKGSLLRS